ncbi:MAG: hypothetical protein MUF72_20780 [Elainella sp. Prado103]|jgi:Ca2+-binding RTX toxin-like protein|nr:hypothetical protein [Elainella sp. Prado103]
MPRVKSKQRRRTAVSNAATQRDFTLITPDWLDSNAQDGLSNDIVFMPGETEKSIQLTIRGDRKFDGTRALVWTIEEEANFGFSQEIYIFNESIAGNPDDNPNSSPDPAERFINSTPQAISLQLNSPIAAAIIIIEEDELPDRILRGTANGDVLSVPNQDFVNAENRLPAAKYGYAAYGYGGDDLIWGAEGSDDLFGWEGNDSLHGGNLSDHLVGNSGNDQLYGEPETAIDSPDAGDDLLDGGAGDDWLFGGPGADTLYGWRGNDRLKGGNANETGADLLSGEAGEDWLDGGGGHDILVGGTESDRFEFYDPTLDGSDFIADFTPSEDKMGLYLGTATATPHPYRNAGLIFQPDATLLPDQWVLVNLADETQVRALDAVDRLVYNQFSGKLYFDRDGSRPAFALQLIATFTDPTVSPTGEPFPTLSATDIVRFGGLEGQQFTGNSKNNTLKGTGLDDWLTGKAGQDRLTGWGGNDVIHGGGGKDILRGGEGEDVLHGGKDEDIFYGGTGVDWFVLERGAGFDKIMDFRRGQDRLGLARGIPANQLTLTQEENGTLMSAGKDALVWVKGVKPAAISNLIAQGNTIIPISLPPI